MPFHSLGRIFAQRYAVLSQYSDSIGDVEDAPLSVHNEKLSRASLSTRVTVTQALFYGVVGILGFLGLLDIIRRISAGTVSISLEPEWASLRDNEYQFLGHDCYCGLTRAESLANGCVLDELSMMWLNRKCIDMSLTQEFSRKGPNPDGSWTYYLDPAGHQALLLADIAQLDDMFTVVYTTNEWHLVHCVYYWRKLFRQPLSGITMEPDAQVEHHLLHCAHDLLKQNLNMSAIGHSADLAPPRGTIDLPGVELNDLLKGRYKPMRL